MTDPLGAAAPAEPHEGQKRDAAWFGHPAQLARLFTTEAMERFGYYGMRALLTLYLAQHFLFSDTTTTGLYGGFTATVRMKAGMSAADVRKTQAAFYRQKSPKGGRALNESEGHDL